MSLFDEIMKYRDRLLNDKIMAAVIIKYMSDKEEYKSDEQLVMHFVNVLIDNEYKLERNISGYITNNKYIIGYNMWLNNYGIKNKWGYLINICPYSKSLIDDSEKLSIQDFCEHCNDNISVESLLYNGCEVSNVTFELLLPSMVKSAR